MPTIIFRLRSKQKMAAGIPLTDEDREPWLQVLNGLLRRWDADGKQRSAGVFGVEGEVPRCS